MFFSVQYLWSVVHSCLGADGTIDSFLTLADTTSEQCVFSIPPGLDAIFILFCILVHQLQAIDDVEFIAESKSLTLGQFGCLVQILKSILYRGYWIRPVTQISEGENQSLRHNLYMAQLVLISTKLYKQLAARNERLNFLPEQEWLWSSLSSADLEV